MVFTASLLDVQHLKGRVTSSLLSVTEEIGQQVRLLCTWARHLTALPLPSSGFRLVVTGGSLTQRPKRLLCCLLVKVLDK